MWVGTTSFVCSVNKSGWPIWKCSKCSDIVHELWDTASCDGEVMLRNAVICCLEEVPWLVIRAAAELHVVSYRNLKVSLGRGKLFLKINFTWGDKSHVIWYPLGSIFKILSKNTKWNAELSDWIRKKKRPDLMLPMGNGLNYLRT